jgi:hypothetical protein
MLRTLGDMLLLFAERWTFYFTVAVILAACPDTCFDLDFVVGMVYSGLS